MARPKKGEEKHRSESVRFRVKPEIRETMDAIVKARGPSASLADVAEEALAIGLRQLEKQKAEVARPQPRERHAAKMASAEHLKRVRDDLHPDRGGNPAAFHKANLAYLRQLVEEAPDAASRKKARDKYLKVAGLPGRQKS